MSSFFFELKQENELAKIAEAFFCSFFPKEETKSQKPLIVSLSGELGAGKTTLVRYLLGFLGIENQVSSPTYVLENQYQSKDFKISHWDFYRLRNDSAIEIRSEIEQRINEKFSLILIEWLENISDLGDLLYLRINISCQADEGRRLEFCQAKAEDSNFKVSFDKFSSILLNS